MLYLLLGSYTFVILKTATFHLHMFASCPYRTWHYWQKCGWI